MQKRLFEVGVVCSWGVLVAGCGAEAGRDELTGTETEAIGITACAAATRDAVLTTNNSQATGIDSPQTFDNPGCNEGYVVEYDGVGLNGFHYGYGLENPRAGSTDGIQVTFTAPPVHSLATCEGAIQAGGYIYEKQSDGTWKFLQRQMVGATTLVNFGRTTGCAIPKITFKNVLKGSLTLPHIYRTALTIDIIDPSQFVPAGSYPDGAGYGTIHQEGCDVNNPCP